jgi:hypothetical protein
VDGTENNTEEDESEKDGMLVRECQNDVVHGIFIVALVMYLPGNYVIRISNFFS